MKVDQMDKGLKQPYILLLKYGGKIKSYMVSESTYTLIMVDQGPYRKVIFVRTE